MALDLDNTISNCIYSDYFYYVKTCESLNHNPICFTQYEILRRNSGLNEILVESGINSFEKFIDARRLISKNELPLIFDPLLVRFELFKEASTVFKIVILTNRRSRRIVESQLDLNQIYLKGIKICNTFDLKEDEVIRKKSLLLKKYKPLLYIGDKKSDREAARNAEVEFRGVCTGFFGPSKLGDSKETLEMILQKLL